MFIKNSVFIILLLTIVNGLAGCIPRTPEDFESEEALFRYSVELMEEGKDRRALKFFEAFRTTYPISRNTPDATLYIGDLHMRQKAYIEAVGSYQQFSQLYPTHPRLNYALFQMAEAHKKQIPRTVDRDQTHVVQALNLYQQVKDDSEFSKAAAEQIDSMQRQLALRERYVASYYLKRKQWSAAELRLLRLLNQYGFADLHEQALADLVLLYSKTDQPNKAAERYSQLKESSKNNKLIEATEKYLQ